MDSMTILAELQKTLTAGSYNVAPQFLNQGAALQTENLDSVLKNVTFQSEHIVLQDELEIMPCKSTTYQFDRQLSYGQFGGSAQFEGAVGQFEDSQFIRATVPMAYYSHLRRVTLQANMVNTIDGVKAEDRQASDAAMKIAGDMEFDLFRGKADFSNAGVFDGNDLAIAELPNMMGVDPQIRRSDLDSNTQDLMFAEYGSDLSVVISGGGILSQPMIEDGHVRSVQNFGDPDRLLVDPFVVSAYNKAQASNQRIVLGGSAQNAVGQDVREQWVAGGKVALKASRFLSGKFKPQRARLSYGAPIAPTFSTGQSAGATPFTATTVFTYFVTAGNQIGESGATASQNVTVSANGNLVTLTITPGTVAGSASQAKFFNVYRSAPNGGIASARYIGRVKYAGTSTVVFTDLGNKLPGFVTGFMIEPDTMRIPELAAYSRLPIAAPDLSKTEAHFRFASLACHQPRKNVLIDNLVGTF